MTEELAGNFDEGASRGGLALAVRDLRMWWLAMALFAVVGRLASPQTFFSAQISSGRS